MRTYKIELELKCLDSITGPRDFELEIDAFNTANKGLIEVEVKSIEMKPPEFPLNLKKKVQAKAK